MENVRKKKMKDMNVMDIVIIVFLGIVALLSLFPFYNVVIISFAKYSDIVKNPFYFYPRSFDLSSYKFILSEKTFLSAFMVTVFITVAGTLWNMFLSVCAAYSLSKRFLPGRKIILYAIVFTMFFNGGLIPYYLVVKSLGLVNNILVMIIPAGINTVYMLIMKTYFSNIPASLEESAKIDGANDIYILISIILPTSAPFIATFTLFYAVERWNEWWFALLFIIDSGKYPIQIVLREILINFSQNIGTMGRAIMDSRKPVYMQGLQMASIVVTSIPILLVYPYLQRYFVKGIMIGSIKG